MNDNLTPIKIPYILLLKKVTAYGFLGFFSYLMLLITLQYIPVRLDVAFLQIKEEAIQHGYYQIAFFWHVFSGMFVLVAGFTQFSTFFRTKYRKLHINIGKVYIFTVLLISGPSGLLMGYFANGGIMAQTAFCLLAVLWMFFTYQAFSTIKKGDVAAHTKWMYRSYALTLSAISLRLWKWGIVLIFQPRPMDVYRTVAWLGWVGNLFIAEWLIYKMTKKNGWPKTKKPKMNLRLSAGNITCLLIGVLSPLYNTIKIKCFFEKCKYLDYFLKIKV